MRNTKPVAICHKLVQVTCSALHRKTAVEAGVGLNFPLWDSPALTTNPAALCLVFYVCSDVYRKRGRKSSTYYTNLIHCYY